MRKKLLVTFGTLTLLSVVVAAVSLWAIAQWRSGGQGLQEHFTRSLQVQRIEAATYSAAKEVPDAVLFGGTESRQEFEEAIETVEPDLETWADLAYTDEEIKQVEEVRESYDTLVENSYEIFDLVEAGYPVEAAYQMEEQLEERDLVQFNEATERAVASDLEYRQVILEQNESVRRNAQLVLLIAAFGITSLLLLLAAYLVSDLFRPLREVEEALNDVQRGDLKRRLDGERADELGAVAGGPVERGERRDRGGRRAA